MAENSPLASPGKPDPAGAESTLLGSSRQRITTGVLRV
jgi:hypothetical protein